MLVWNTVFLLQNKAGAPTAPEKFVNAALFLRFGQPSILIRHENEAFRKRSSNRSDLNTPVLCFNVDRKRFEN